MSSPEFTPIDGSAQVNSTSCSLQGVPGIFEVVGGDIVFQPSDTATGGCCWQNPHGEQLVISIKDVLGATSCTHKKQPAFLISTCPVKQDKNAKKVRNLVTKGPFVCAREEEAATAVTRVRAALPVPVSRTGGKAVFAIVNPQAGKAQGRKAWAQVEQLLLSAGISPSMQETQSVGHAEQLAAALDVESLACILVVGGDGSLYEVVQGLRAHVEAPKALRVPLCHVPAGSGNGIAASCGLWTPTTAAHAVVHGPRTALDAATVLQPACGQRYLCLLSIQHGLLTTLDIDTQHLRFLGGARFDVGAARDIVKFQAHKARIALVPEAASRAVRARAAAASNDSPARYPPTPVLDELTATPPPMADAAQWPDGWEIRMLDSIRLLNVAGPQWAALDFKLNPWGVPDNGYWDLTLDTCTSRIEALKLFMSAADGSHMSSPCCTSERVAAFAIEPIEKTCYVTVDGEEIPFEPLYMEVHQGLLTVVSAP